MNSQLQHTTQQLAQCQQDRDQRMEEVGAPTRKVAVVMCVVMWLSAKLAFVEFITFMELKNLLGPHLIYLFIYILSVL